VLKQAGLLALEAAAGYWVEREAARPAPRPAPRPPASAPPAGTLSRELVLWTARTPDQAVLVRRERVTWTPARPPGTP
jgi:hypothetical protein